MTMAKKEDHSSSDGVKSPAMNGIDPKHVSNTNGVSDMENMVTTTEPSATKETKKVTITEPPSEAAGDIPNLKASKSERQLDAVDLDDELENGNTPMEMGVGKKKKKKSKPKSKRGLVLSHIWSSVTILTKLCVLRTHQPDLRNTTLMLRLHQPNMR